MRNVSIQRLTKSVVKQMLEAESQPTLPPNEEAKIEQAMAMDHLYYSSALEGSRLNREQLQRAVYEGSQTS